MQKNIDWDAVTISNNFLFQEILRNKSLCKQLLECVLHIQIRTIRYTETEKTMNAQLSSKNTRLDVYVEDNYGNIADIEMQTTNNKGVINYDERDEKTVISELPLRTRYYQNIIGTNMLRKGMHYRELKKAYVIFICTFDPFTLGLPVYHFTYRCRENCNLQMGDLTENIFLNVKAADKTDDEELAAFLRYVNGQCATTSFTRQLDKEAMRIKNNDDWRLRAMTLDMEIQDMKYHIAKREREKGRKERTIEIAKAMLADGMEISKVAKLTKLSTKEVAALV
ncbi:MAG: Rpn family recombination-promoting nuclease/putative transposase [Acidaminococcaceae bacterium]|nr:Rpn family recombination-promoting nuclease/putative transposase [Acidaminococcaceae bacterium]MBQ9698923.1 Rpn family recombination-promoting nuclease/putative transposase [Acidaminococcaceae bacterium]